MVAVRTAECRMRAENFGEPPAPLHACWKESSVGVKSHRGGMAGASVRVLNADVTMNTNGNADRTIHAQVTAVPMWRPTGWRVFPRRATGAVVLLTRRPPL